MQQSPTKLRQQRALLCARQGDPDTPASGTLYARKHRLQTDLDRARTAEAAISSPSPERHLAANVGLVAKSRAVSHLERLVKQIDEEIDAVQKRIESIDKMLAKNGNKDRE